MSESEPNQQPERPEPLVGDKAETAPERASWLGFVLTVLLGVVLLAVLIPFTQWIDVRTHYSPLEVSAPPSGAMGILFGFLLVNVIIFVLARMAPGRWGLINTLLLVPAGALSILYWLGLEPSDSLRIGYLLLPAAAVVGLGWSLYRLFGMRNGAKGWQVGLLSALLVLPTAALIAFWLLNRYDVLKMNVTWLFWPVLALVVLSAIFFLISRVCGGFRRWQLALLYVMLMIGLPVMNVGLVQPMVSNVASVASELVDRGVGSVQVAYDVQHPDIYPKVPYDRELTPEEREEQIKPLKRFWSGSWVTPREEAQLEQLSLWERISYSWSQIQPYIWLRPLVNWGGFVFLLFLGIMCLMEVLRQEWVERENLAFPLAALPSALIEESGQSPVRHKLLGNPLFWVGTVVGGFVLLLAGLHHSFPDSFPAARLAIKFTSIFDKAPWKALGSNVLVVSPLIIGIGYLVHLELSRSIWLVFFIGAVFVLAATNLGWNVVDQPNEPLDWGAPPYPFPKEQGFGALLALAVFLLWRSRGGLLALIKAPFSRRGGPSGSGFVPRRIAAWGFFICFAAAAIQMGRMFKVAPHFSVPPNYEGNVGGINWPLILLWLTVFYLMIVAFARLRAEAGIPNNFLLPAIVRFPRLFGGPQVWGWRSSQMINHYSWMTLSSLPAMGPLQLEGLEVARRHGPEPRKVGIAVFIAFAVAFVGGLVAFLINAYIQGGGDYMGQEMNYAGTFPVWTFYNARGLNLNVGYWHTARIVAIVVGLVLMVGLLAARSRWMRFPIHPLGYLTWCLVQVHQSWVPNRAARWVHLLWAPMLIAWLLKRTLIRYGGMRLYRKMLPIALGLIFGQLAMLAVWAAVHGYLLYHDPNMETHLYAPYFY